MEGKNLFEKAIKNKNYNKLKQLLENRSKVYLNSIFGKEDILILNMAILQNDVQAVKMILEAGADPNGLTPDGYFYNIPLTQVDINKSAYKEIVRLLLSYGADINLIGPRGETALTTGLKNMKTKLSYDNLFYILERGANPNKPRDNFPLEIAFKINTDNQINPKCKLEKNCNEYKVQQIRDIALDNCGIYLWEGGNKKKKQELCNEIKEIADKNKHGGLSKKDVIETLIYFGANPNYKSGDEPIKVPEEYKYILEPLENMLDKCENKMLIQKMARAMQIPVKDDLQSMCKCIKFIRDNRNNIDFDKIKQIRQKFKELKLGVKCYNEYDALYVNEIDEFSHSDLYFYTDNANNTYCYHMSELPSLIERRKDLNNIDLPQNIIDDMIDKLKMFPPYTLEEGIDLLSDKFGPEESTWRQDKLTQLSRIIKSYNPYSEIDNIADLPITAYKTLFRKVGNYPDVKNFGESNQQYHDRLLNEIIIEILDAIRNKRKDISQVSYYLYTIFNMYNHIAEMEKQLGKQDFINIIDQITYYRDYTNLRNILGDENYDKIFTIVEARYPQDTDLYWENELQPELEKYADDIDRGLID